MPAGVSWGFEPRRWVALQLSVIITNAEVKIRLPAVGSAENSAAESRVPAYKKTATITYGSFVFQDQ